MDTSQSLSTAQLLVVVLPLLLLDLGLIIYSLYDLTRPERLVKWFPKPVWAVIILFVSTFGALIYLFVGRDEG